MYVVQTTTSNNDKIIAGIVTSFFLLGTYLALRWTGLPEVKQKTETYEEINWTKFKPKPEKIFEKAEPVKPIEVEQPVKFEPIPQAPFKPNPQQKIDLSSLKKQFESLTEPSQAPRNKNLKKEPTSVSKQQMKVDLKKPSLLSGLNMLVGESSQKFKLPNRGRKGRDKNGPAILTAGSGSDIDIGNGTNYSSGEMSLGAPEAKSIDAGTVQIGLLDDLQMGQDFTDLSPIYRALIEWMKRHPSQFPDVVNRFMERTPGDLTSKINFQIGNRRFEMFLLCKEKLYEVRICLLEGNESTYLIDRGFKENSSFLRVGSVNRTSNGNILSFGTTRKAASNRRTKEFYQIFLSWWGTVK